MKCTATHPEPCGLGGNHTCQRDTHNPDPTHDNITDTLHTCQCGHAKWVTGTGRPRLWAELVGAQRALTHMPSERQRSYTTGLAYAYHWMTGTPMNAIWDQADEQTAYL